MKIWNKNGRFTSGDNSKPQGQSGNHAACERIQELESTVLTLRKEVERLTLETEYLRIATTVAPTTADIERSRAVLSELVREIDKCITELNE